jgi:ribosomal-protein-alanine N-acetyltransferase
MSSSAPIVGAESLRDKFSDVAAPAIDEGKDLGSLTVKDSLRKAMTTGRLAYPDPPLTDGAIRARPWTVQDLPAIESASHDPYIPTVTSVPSVYTDEEGRAFVERQWKRIAGGHGLSLCIADARTDAALGFIGLGLENRAHGRASFGYWVVPGARGRGVAPAAVRLMSAWAFSSLGLARLEILVEPWNSASLRVADQAGFRREGVLRSYEKFKGRRADLIMHARTADDECAAHTASDRQHTYPAYRSRDEAAHVRRAMAGDWDAVWSLLQGMGKVVGPENAARQRFERVVQDHGHCVRVAVADDAVAGYMWAQDYGGLIIMDWYRPTTCAHRHTCTRPRMIVEGERCATTAGY